MKKLLFGLLVLGAFSSCDKEGCKERRDAKLKALFLSYQQQLNNTNLTQRQISEISIRYEEKKKTIEAECK